MNDTDDDLDFEFNEDFDKISTGIDRQHNLNNLLENSFNDEPLIVFNSFLYVYNLYYLQIIVSHGKKDEVMHSLKSFYDEYARMYDTHTTINVLSLFIIVYYNNREKLYVNNTAKDFLIPMVKIMCNYTLTNNDLFALYNVLINTSINTLTDIPMNINQDYLEIMQLNPTLTTLTNYEMTNHINKLKFVLESEITNKKKIINNAFMYVYDILLLNVKNSIDNKEIIDDVKIVLDCIDTIYIQMSNKPIDNITRFAIFLLAYINYFGGFELIPSSLLIKEMVSYLCKGYINNNDLHFIYNKLFELIKSGIKGCLVSLVNNKKELMDNILITPYTEGVSKINLTEYTSSTFGLTRSRRSKRSKRSKRSGSKRSKRSE